jgi:hypothetical protein
VATRFRGSLCFNDMFIGHFAVAFAAKRVSPRTSLGATFVAAQLVDLLWPIFLLLGWERVRITRSDNPFLVLDFTSYPWSHSLIMGAVWGIALGALYFAFTRYRRGAVVVGLLVPSHWLLDVVVHMPDLPLYPGGGTKFGFGLWQSPAATVIVEIALLVAGIMIYSRTTHPRDRAGRYGLWSLAGFLVLLYVVSAVSPPPPSVNALAWTALIGWPLALWPWWVDRHRDVRVSPAARGLS